MKLTATLILCSTLALTACGETKTDRAVSGAAIGATAGAIVAGNPWAGAAVGGAAGAAVGGLTDSRDFNFGRPIWR